MPKSADFNASSKSARSGRLDISPDRVVELLNELRDRLAEGVASSFAQNLKQARNDMMQLAQRASEPARQELYSSGHSILTNGGTGLLQRFRNVFSKDCDQTIARLMSNEADAWDSADELSLVDSNEFERDLAVGRLSAKATYQCSQQLTALDRRVAALLNLKHIDSDSSPFAIKRVFTAFVKGAEANWTGEHLSLILLETFEHYTADELPKVYQGLNEYLVQEGILEKLPVEIEEREQHLQQRNRVDDLDGNIGDIFLQLANGLMLRNRSIGDGSQNGDSSGGSGVGGGSGCDLGGMGEPGGPVTQATDASPPSSEITGRVGGICSDRESGQAGPMVFGQFFAGLTGLQRGSGQAAAKLGVDVGDFDSTNSAMLRSLAASPLLRWLQPNDAMTIELIAMLFDCIFSDSDIPDALGAELGRLQVPILKVALINKGFFSDQQHPARRLMDVIATAVRGWSSKDEAELLEQIRTAVNNVLSGFEEDMEVFSAQIENLEKILNDADHRARENVSDLVHRLEQRDRKLVADTLVKDEIERRQPKQALPSVVEAFIDDVWQDLLTRIYIKAGDKAEVWRQALTTLDDLIWSVQPKTQPEERSRLMGMLPTLLRRLPEGMALLGKRDDWDPFLQSLMQLHMEAIKPKQPPEANAATPAETSPAPAADFGLAPAADVAAPVSLEEIEPDSTLIASLARDNSAGVGANGALPSETPEAGISAGVGAGGQQANGIDAEHDDKAEDEFMAAARRIEIGDWVEFSNIASGNLTLRASWISPLNGLILFADRQGRNATVLPLQRIAKLLRKANARLLSPDSLTDRAVAKLLVTATPKETAHAQEHQPAEHQPAVSPCRRSPRDLKPCDRA